MPYADFFIAPVRQESYDTYSDFARQMHPIFKDMGALEAADFWADDVPDGKVTSLPMAVKCEPGEVVAAGWVLWPDKETRDAGWQKMMTEEGDSEMPFDGKRMIFGGFSEIATMKR